MPDVGVHELKAHASKIIREVREEQAQYVITYRGRPVGLLTPFEHAGLSAVRDQETAELAWDALTRLGEEIGRGWRSPLTSDELLSEMRR